MQDIAASSKVRLVATVSGRFMAFVALIGLSVPMSAELATFMPSLPADLGVPADQFGHLVDDYVFKLIVNWPLLALAPISLVGTVLGTLPDYGAIFWSCVGWAPIGLAYAWATRNRQLFFFVLSVYPFIWVIGIVLRLMLSAAAVS